jgi:hypothetical protein
MENYITSTNLSKEWNQDDPGNCSRIYILATFVKIYGGILASKLWNWLLYQGLTPFQVGFVKSRRMMDHYFKI